jgi:hypothetical protein
VKFLPISSTSLTEPGETEGVGRGLGGAVGRRVAWLGRLVDGAEDRAAVCFGAGAMENGRRDGRREGQQEDGAAVTRAVGLVVRAIDGREVAGGRRAVTVALAGRSCRGDRRPAGRRRGSSGS